MAMNAKQRQTRWELLGFNVGTASSGAFRLSCDCCQVVIINGIPCHETGCPNAHHECAGCDAIIPQRQRYCEDCQ